MKKITVRWLKSRGACDPKLKRFNAVFGNSAEVSYENADIWRKEVRGWRQDFLWLFWASLAHTYTPSGIEILKQLTDYMKLQTSDGGFDMYFSAREKLLMFGPKRLSVAMTQIMYRV